MHKTPARSKKRPRPLPSMDTVKSVSRRKLEGKPDRWVTCKACGHRHDCSAIAKRLRRAEERERAAREKLAASRKAALADFRRKRINAAVAFQMAANGSSLEEIGVALAEGDRRWPGGMASYAEGVLQRLDADIRAAADARFLPCGTEERPHNFVISETLGDMCLRCGKKCGASTGYARSLRSTVAHAVAIFGLAIQEMEVTPDGGFELKIANQGRALLLNIPGGGPSTRPGVSYKAVGNGASSIGGAEVASGVITTPIPDPSVMHPLMSWVRHGGTLRPGVLPKVTPLDLLFER